MTPRSRSPRFAPCLASCLTALVLLPGFLPGAVTAQQSTFSLPQGCEAFVTVQMQACSVSHHFTCADDPEGLQRRVDLEEDGLVYVGAIDAETQWIESFHVLSGHTERLDPDPADPASFSGLLASGRDGFDFTTSSPEIGTSRYVGQDRLTGETVTIDGVTLDVTAYRIRALDADGSEMWRAAGNEYIHRDWRMFLSGTGTITTPDESWESADAPMEFIFPGEPGFLSANSKYGCGALMSAYRP